MTDTTKAREAVVLLQSGIVNFNDVDRECVADILAALDSHDALVVENARLRAHRLAVAEATGIVYEADWTAPEPGPDDVVIAEIRRLQREPETLRARLAEWEGLRGDIRKVANAYSGRHDNWTVREAHGRLLATLNREDEPESDPQVRRIELLRRVAVELGEHRGCLDFDQLECEVLAVLAARVAHLNREADRG